MEEHDRICEVKLEQLKQAICEGLEGEPTPWNPEEIKRKGREKRASRILAGEA